MKDPEFILLRNRFVLIVLISLIFIIPSILLFINKFSVNKLEINTKLNKKETFLVLITSNDCQNCKNIKSLFKENNIKYLELNKDSSNQYKEILNKLQLDSTKTKSPTLIYVLKGKNYSYLENEKDFEKESLNNFLNIYNLK